jgi:hypothetical protein
MRTLHGADARFVKPSVVGEGFAREAVERSYEHGLSGCAVPLLSLDVFLTTDAYGVSVALAACKMRSLDTTLKINQADDALSAAADSIKA